MDANTIQPVIIDRYSANLTLIGIGTDGLLIIHNAHINTASGKNRKNCTDQVSPQFTKIKCSLIQSPEFLNYVLLIVDRSV